MGSRPVRGSNRSRKLSASRDELVTPDNVRRNDPFNAYNEAMGYGNDLMKKVYERDGDRGLARYHAIARATLDDKIDILRANIRDAQLFHNPSFAALDNFERNKAELSKLLEQRKAQTSAYLKLQNELKKRTTEKAQLTRVAERQARALGMAMEKASRLMGDRGTDWVGTFTKKIGHGSAPMMVSDSAFTMRNALSRLPRRGENSITSAQTRPLMARLLSLENAFVKTLDALVDREKGE